MSASDDRHRKVETLVARWGQRLHRYSWSLDKRPEERQDIMCTVIARLYHQDWVDQVDPESEEAGRKLVRMAWTESRNRWRAETRRSGREDVYVGETDQSPQLPSEALEASKRAQAAIDAILDLPDPYAEIVRLRYWAELEFPVIAEMLGLPEGTVKSRLRKALQLLSGKLGFLKPGGDR